MFCLLAFIRFWAYCNVLMDEAYGLLVVLFGGKNGFIGSERRYPGLDKS